MKRILLTLFSVSTSLVAIAQPANDNFANAIEIIGTETNITGSNVGATRQAGEPSDVSWPAPGNLNRRSSAGAVSVWWRWKATVSSAITLQAGSFDTQLGVYTGILGNFNEVASDEDAYNPLTGQDNSLGNGRSFLTFNASRGTTYHIMVNGYDNITGQIFLTLSQSNFISNLGAFQIQGTKKIKVTYESFRSANITLAFSQNGGASFNLTPSPGSLSGDVGNVASGSHQIIWDIGTTLPAQTFSANFVAKIIATTANAAVSRISPPFTMDLQGLSSGLTVQGKVLDAQTRVPLNGTLVTLAGQSTATASDGKFSFANVSLDSGNTLNVSRSGYASYSGVVPVSAGSTAATLSDILLQPITAENVNKPIVTGIRPRYDGLFISAASLINEYTASVDWADRTPKHVEFYVNGVLRHTATTTSAEATWDVNMAQWFTGSFSSGANKISAVAVDTLNVRSPMFTQTIRMIPMPPLLMSGAGVLAPFQFIPGNDPVLSFSVIFPSDEIPSEALKDIPLLGKFGWNFAVGGGVEYALNSGEWQAHLGIAPYGRWSRRTGERPHSTLLHPKFFAGNKTIDFSASVQAEGRATQSSGISLDDVGVEISADFEREILAFYLSDYVPATQWIRCLDWFKRVGVDPNSIQRVTVYGELGAALSLNAQVNPPPIQYEETTVSLTLGARASYEPDMKVARGEVTVGGRVTGEFQIHPGLDFNSVVGAMYGRVSFTALSFNILNEEFVLLNYKWPQNGLRYDLRTDKPEWAWIRVVSDPITTVRRAGPEKFTALDTSLKRESVAGAPRSTLEAFRQIGQYPAKGSVASNASKGQSPSASDGEPASDFSQVDLTIASNVFPGSAPTLANHGQELMLLYVTDNGTPNDLQFTDIRWTRWNGTAWSVPMTLHTNTQAEFAPQVAFDGYGNAIAVWERVADTNFNQTNLTAMAAQMEIVWSKWNSTNNTWSVSVALTTNDILDHAPLLCGPMADGSVLAVWTRNDSNLLMGTNGANSQVLSSSWNLTNQSWSSPQTLVTNLPYRLSQSFAGASSRAVFAWTRDMDGVLTNANDQQVFYCGWTNGVWGAAQQFTTNSLGNRNARVSVASSGDAYLIWQQASNLVMSANFSTNTSLARADSETAGFADYAMTFGPAGNLVLLWQEMSQDGSDAHYAVYDPASQTWSKDDQFFHDAALERSFAPVWDNVGNLTFAYNKVQMTLTNKTVTLEGGGEVTITNVPQPGRVDLCVTKRALVRDLALQVGDFGADGGNFLPGDAVTLSATARNIGNVAVSNLVVAFWDGNPTNGGTLITNVTLSGWLEGAATNVATALWIVPEPATNHFLYAIVNPSGLASEFDELNNQQSLSIGGIDLAASLVSYSVETNGAVRIIAQVQNLGAPSATNSVLAIRWEGQTNAPLTTVAIPMLEPGRLAQVALDLPSGTQPEGEAIYRLFADDMQAIADVDTNNNTTAFAVNLFLDSDGDGIPDGWETTNGLDPHDSADALLDSDEDGASNLAEYLAGTDPGDGNSYLRIAEIALGGAGTNSWFQVTWGSQSNRLYSIERSLDLNTFTTISQHIIAAPPENTFTDTTATNSSAYFYRIKVE